jgi:hypothetical protein
MDFLKLYIGGFYWTVERIGLEVWLKQKKISHFICKTT